MDASTISARRNPDFNHRLLDQPSEAKSRKAKNRNCQSGINARASILTLTGAEGVASLGSGCSSIVFTSDQIVEINKAAEQRSADECE